MCVLETEYRWRSGTKRDKRAGVTGKRFPSVLGGTGISQQLQMFISQWLTHTHTHLAPKVLILLTVDKIMFNVFFVVMRNRINQSDVLHH